MNSQLSSLSGTILDGGFEVQEMLRSEPHASVFGVRVLGDRFTEAEVTFFGSNERAAAAQMEGWRRAEALRSPHLNAPLSFGTHTLAGETIPYVVLVKADETLAGVIRERPLEAEEATETMLSVARGLVDLHTGGLIHGFVSAEHILAIGQDIKVSGHTARPVDSNFEPYPYTPVHVAPECSGCNSTPAADVWCLGASLMAAFNQKAGDDSRLAFIAKRCLESNPASRATAAEAVDMLEGRIPAAIPKTAPLAAAAAATSGSNSPPNISLPNTKTPPAPVGELAPVEFRGEKRPIWLYAGGGVLLVLIVLWLAWPRHSVPVETKQVEAPQRIPQASVPQHEASVPANFGTTARPTISGEQNWRVIVYAYHRRENAEEMAGFINHRHPELEAKVFQPRGESVLYLVTVGSPMTREEALRFLSRATDSGMPRDSYIQNYRSE